MKLRTVLMSHLSDIQVESTFHFEREEHQQKVVDRIALRVNYLKWLLSKHPNTEIEIDPDAEYDLFRESFEPKTVKS
jgi:hypothetical protein